MSTADAIASTAPEIKLMLARTASPLVMTELFRTFKMLPLSPDTPGPLPPLIEPKTFSEAPARPLFPPVSVELSTLIVLPLSAPAALPPLFVVRCAAVSCVWSVAVVFSRRGLCWSVQKREWL